MVTTDGLEINMYAHEPQHDLPTALPPSMEFTQQLSVGSEPQTIAKAVIAVATALGAAIATAVSDGHVTWPEVALGILGAIIAGASVWAVTNKP
jgi:hypothetical protein